MRQYQRDIVDWNRENVALKMQTMSFGFKIVPYLNANWTQKPMVVMQHKDTSLHTEEEKEL